MSRKWIKMSQVVHAHLKGAFMVRKRMALAALALVATVGCCHRDRPGLLGRIRGQSAATCQEQCPGGTGTFQPCGCEREMGAPIIYDGGITRPPNVQEMPPYIPPTATPMPGEAKPGPAGPSKGSEMSRPKEKTNLF